jgi:hypothetical protein
MAEIIGPTLDQLDTWGTLDSLDAYGTLEYLDNINLFEVAAAENIAVTATATAGRKVSFAASVTGAFSVAASGAFYKAGFNGSASISITATAVAATSIVDMTASASNIALSTVAEIKGKFAFAAADTIAITGSTTTGVNYKAAYAASVDLSIEGVAIAEEMGEAWTDIVPATAVFNTRTAGTDRWLNQ